MQWFHYSKQQQWTNSAFYNTVTFIIQMALSAQEPVIYCLHGFVSFLLGRYFHVSCNMVFKVTNAYKSYGIMCINHEKKYLGPKNKQTKKNT